MANISCEQVATRGALFEIYFDRIVEYYQNNAWTGKNLDLSSIDPELKCLKDYELVAPPKEINTSAGNAKSAKCLAIKAPDGSIQVHFRGTGDGYWTYNDSAYGDTPSEVQKESAAYLESVIRDNPDADIYVSGHSQGGNTAQYATLAVDPQYGKSIICSVSLDGQGFSEEVVKQLQAKYGYDYYSEQLAKIYAYNGYRDFVSPLGQVQVVPEDHVYMVITSDDGINTDETSIGFRAHAANFMIEKIADENGNITYDLCKNEPYNADNNRESSFRKLVILINEKVKELDKEDQADAATVTMMLVEHFAGDGRGGNIQGESTTPEQWELYSKLLAEVLCEAIEEDPDLLLAVLQEEGIASPDGAFIDAQTAEYVKKFIDRFNQLPDGVRKTLLAKIIGVVLVVVDDKIEFPLKQWVERIKAVLDLYGVHSVREFIDFLNSSSAETIVDFILSVITDPGGMILSLGKVLADLILIVIVVAALLSLAKIALKLIVALAVIVVALAAIKIAIDSLVELGEKVLAKIKEGIDYIAELSRSVYEHIQQSVSIFVDTVINNAQKIFEGVGEKIREAREAVNIFAGYVRGVIARGQNIFTSIACCISRTVTGRSQQPVSINVTLLSDAVDSIQRLANRVQAIDQRLDRLYGRLANSEIEQPGDVVTTLVNLYNLTRADINVDEGNRIRRMANNLSGLYTGYDDAERWALQLL